LDFNGDRHAIDVGAHVGAVGAERSFQRRVANSRVPLQRLENLHLAKLVRFGFSAAESARQEIFVREIINP
jgi:hypothetical protein